jgi:DNA/RNA-binding domain of Phe-tRNA-synthetase-like protein
MHFQHSGEIWRDYPELVPGVLFAEGITGDASVDSRLAPFTAIAAARLTDMAEGELPEIQAWRRAFSRMGLKPTQYRCAAESLLRRFKRERSLARIHPLIDLCNAVSLAFAIPVAVFDASRVAAYLEVRYAAGDETYVTFSGEVEHPEPGEVIFADEARRAHARRWTYRQSGYSAVQETTTAVWAVRPETSILSESSPRFNF